MPKRGIIATLLTMAGLALLLTFKTPADAGLPGRGNGSLSRAFAATATPTPAPQGGEPGEGGGDDGGGALAPATPSPTPAPSATPAAGQTASRTITGPVIPTRYGDVQLRVTLTHGRISDITPLQLPVDRQRSAYISSVAAPILRDEALQAQSAQIDLLSGAT